MNVSFPAFSLPVAADSSIVVVGGGAAGAAAAIAAGRRGAQVLLLEQRGCCGGMMTSGLLPSIITMTDGKNMLSGGLCKELVDLIASQMEEKKPNYSWQDIRSEEVKIILDEMLEAAGIKVFYEVTVSSVCRDGDAITALECWTPGGRFAVTGKYFIDATGDGNLSAMAGVPFQYGNEAHKVMAPTLCTGFDNIDFSVNTRRNGLGRDEWAEAMKAGTAPLQEGHFVGFFRNGPSEGLGNLGHIYETDVLDLESRSNAWTQGRKLALVYRDFFRKNVTGFANAQLAKTGEALGIRESRRIEGDYILCQDDYLNRRHFSDEIGSFAYPIDIHSSKKDVAAQAEVEKKLAESTYRPGENYGIPYRTLTAKGVTNLLVAGRCISTDRAMQSSVRVVPGCMITGEAAGTAAALASKRSSALRAIDIALLQDQLREQGLFIPGSK